MADEATPQETATENAVTETVDTAATVDSTTDIGADVQGTETENTVTDSVDETGKATKTYDESYVRKLRDENAATRVKAKDAEKAAQEAARQAQEAADAQKSLTEKLGRALGFVQDDAPLAPEELLKQASAREAQLAAERDAASERLRAYERKDALTAAADKSDGDLASILDSVSINEAIKKLDPTADDFPSQVEAIVDSAVTSNPKLKKAPAQAAAPRSGGDLSNGNGSTKPTGEPTIDDVRREKRALAARELS